MTLPFAQVMIFELKFDPLILFSHGFFEHRLAFYSLIDMPLIFQVHTLNVLGVHDIQVLVIHQDESKK